MEIIEIKNLSDKLKWMKQFKKNYSGDCLKLPLKVHEPHISRYFVAKEDGKELGFVRITNKSYIDSPLQNIWCISDAYVKAPYRGKGILMNLIRYTKENCDVHMIFMEEERFYENWDYYQKLDFGSFIDTQSTGLAYIYDRELTDSINNYSFNFLKRYNYKLKTVSQSVLYGIQL